jgi:hypothetical protein
MILTKRLAPLTVAVAIGVTGVAVPASAATKTKVWTTKQCQSYKTSFLKRHNQKPTKKQITSANKVLKAHGCKIKA